MKIYKNEIKNGLGEKIQASAMISFASTPIIVIDKGDEIRSYASTDLMKNIGEQRDLAPIQSILVSTGWNANRDVFTPQEAWAARHTPVNKQVNFGHTDAIVGHMVASFVTDFNGNTISDDISFEDLPEDFDIIAAAVLYKKHPNEELRKAVAEILPKIANGEAHVSMECFFNDFDYGLMDAAGEKTIVTRNEDTAWLTKHLSQFGGQGEYNGYTLGRVIKNLTFSGKGIVDNPANKRSIIFSEMKSFSTTNVKNDTEFICVSETKKETNMSEKETVSKEAYDKVVAELDKIRQGEVAQLQAKVETYDEVVAKLQEQIEGLEDKVAEAQENSEKFEGEAKATKEDLEAKVSELESAHKELDQIKAESLKVNRIGKLITAGITEEDAATVVEKWAAASDEQFADIVEMQKAIAEKASMSEEDKKKKEAEKAKASDDEEDATASEVEVEAEAGVTPAVNDEEEKVDISAIASFLGTLNK